MLFHYLTEIDTNNIIALYITQDVVSRQKWNTVEQQNNNPNLLKLNLIETQPYFKNTTLMSLVNLDCQLLPHLPKPSSKYSITSYAVRNSTGKSSETVRNLQRLCHFLNYLESKIFCPLMQLSLNLFNFL